MKYTEAKAKALFLTATRQIDHVIFLTNGQYHVYMKKEWTGEIVETVRYEKLIEDFKPEPKKVAAKRNHSVKDED